MHVRESTRQTVLEDVNAYLERNVKSPASKKPEESGMRIQVRSCVDLHSIYMLNRFESFSDAPQQTHA